MANDACLSAMFAKDRFADKHDGFLRCSLYKYVQWFCWSLMKLAVIDGCSARLPLMPLSISACNGSVSGPYW